MDVAVQEELDKLKELIINAVPVEQIYLFGSYAYGTPHEYSDLDLYVVLISQNFTQRHGGAKDAEEI